MDNTHLGIVLVLVERPSNQIGEAQTELALNLVRSPVGGKRGWMACEGILVFGQDNNI